MLDDQELNRELTQDDKKYLEEFKNVAILSFTNTKITSLKNFPALAELRRIELNGNGLSGSQLVHLLQYKHMHTLKFNMNNVTSFAEVEAIKALTLCNIDLSENPIAAQEDYRKKMFEMFEDLEVLDGEDKEGKIVESDIDDGEEGEFDELDEEQLKKLREGGLALGDDEDDEYDLEDDGEELEGSYGDEDDEESEEQPANKRKK